MLFCNSYSLGQDRIRKRLWKMDCCFLRASGLRLKSRHQPHRHYSFPLQFYLVSLPLSGWTGTGGRAYPYPCLTSLLASDLPLPALPARSLTLPHYHHHLTTCNGHAKLHCGALCQPEKRLPLPATLPSATAYASHASAHGLYHAVLPLFYHTFTICLQDSYLLLLGKGRKGLDKDPGGTE